MGFKKYIPSMTNTIQIVLVVVVLGGLGVIGWVSGLFGKLTGRF